MNSCCDTRLICYSVYLPNLQVSEERSAIMRSMGIRFVSYNQILTVKFQSAQSAEISTRFFLKFLSKHLTYLSCILQWHISTSITIISLFGFEIFIIRYWLLMHNNFMTQRTSILHVQPFSQTDTVEIVTASCNFCRCHFLQRIIQRFR